MLSLIETPDTSGYVRCAPPSRRLCRSSTGSRLAMSAWRVPPYPLCVCRAEGLGWLGTEAEQIPKPAPPVIAELSKSQRPDQVFPGRKIYSGSPMVSCFSQICEILPRALAEAYERLPEASSQISSFFHLFSHHLTVLRERFLTSNAMPFDL